MTEDKRIMDELLADTVAVELPPTSVPVASSRTGGAPAAAQSAPAPSPVEPDPLAFQVSEDEIEAAREEPLSAAPRVKSFLTKALDRMHRRATRNETPLATPWPNLNTAMGGGLWAGCHFVVGNTGTGKTQLALQLALEAARDGTPVLYIGLELDELGLVARLAGFLSGDVHWSDLYTGTAGEAGVIKAQAAMAELHDLPLRLEVAPSYGWDYATLGDRAAAMAHRYRDLLNDKEGNPARPFLIVLDYLQVVAGPADSRDDLRIRMQKASYAARQAARDHNAVVLLLSSTARASYGELDGEPIEKEGKAKVKVWNLPASSAVGKGKESGEIEYSADSVIILAQDRRQKDLPRTVYLGVGKLRAGKGPDAPGLGPGWLPMTFDGARFCEGDSAAGWDSKPHQGPQPKASTKSGGDDDFPDL